MSLSDVVDFKSVNHNIRFWDAVCELQCSDGYRIIGPGYHMVTSRVYKASIPYFVSVRPAIDTGRFVVFFFFGRAEILTHNTPIEISMSLVDTACELCLVPQAIDLLTSCCIKAFCMANLFSSTIGLFPCAELSTTYRSVGRIPQLVTYIQLLFNSCAPWSNRKVILASFSVVVYHPWVTLMQAWDISMKGRKKGRKNSD
jgi:hypothetical protein